MLTARRDRRASQASAVVFLPPTLVASNYGMNFEHMPELKWLIGYPWALGLMIASGIGRGQIDRRRRFTALVILATILSAGISVCESSVMTDSLARRMSGVREET
jgi:hypothetical protein